MRLYGSIFFVTVVLARLTHAEFLDYVRSVGDFFRFKKPDDSLSSTEFAQRIPYEVSAVDEKFISEAAKLTGVALSELDSCQQRVVLKLKTDCNTMNDEQLAKMAVHLLNCQSYVEGRRMYPCSEDMSIKSCTTDMDSDTWTSYHLMSNRAKAVCYSIRQMQFRGLAEHTVNRLMETAQNQLRTLQEITKNQEDLQDIAENTFSSLSQGHKLLTQQQSDIQKAQFHGQLALEDNIRKLSLEKELIIETHNHLLELTRNIQRILEASTEQIGSQVEESRSNHLELIDDLIGIQNKAHIIFERIDQSSELLFKQNEEFKRQYESTLRNLAEVNRTVHNLMEMVGGTRQALEDRLAWIIAVLGDTDLAVGRLYLIVWHVGFLLVSMLTCAFLSARSSTRLVVATILPVNLAVALFTDEQHLGPLGLTVSILGFVLAQIMLLAAGNYKQQMRAALPWYKPVQSISSTQKEGSVATTSSQNVDSSTNIIGFERYQYRSSHTSNTDQMGEEEEEDNTFSAPTPPLSRRGYFNRSRSNTPLQLNGSIKASCKAKTRLGTPCKISSLPGRDYCHRHQMGDSVVG